MLGHVAALKLFPYAAVEKLRQQAQARGQLNRFSKGELALSLPNHKSRTVVRPAPDLMYLAAVFDVSISPVKLRARVPRDTYWSISCYSMSADCFFVHNDSQVEGDDGVVEIFLLGPQHDPRPESLGIADRDKSHTIIVQSPSTTGFLLHRILVLDKKDERKYASWCKENFSIHELDANQFGKPFAPIVGRFYSNLKSGCGFVKKDSMSERGLKVEPSSSGSSTNRNIIAGQHLAELSSGAISSKTSMGFLAWFVLSMRLFSPRRGGTSIVSSTVIPATASLMLGIASAASGALLTQQLFWKFVAPRLNLVPKIRIGSSPWTTIPLAGSAFAGLYSRAAVAMTGLFALTPDEALYFNAGKDEDGDPLMADQEYSIMLPVSAPQLPGRWWSITVYGADHFLIDNKMGKYSVNMKDVNRNNQAPASVPTAQNVNWRWRFTLVPDDCCGERGSIAVLPMGRRRHERVFLTLRLYNPDPMLQQDSHRGIRSVAMPRILKKSGADLPKSASRL